MFQRFRYLLKFQNCGPFVCRWVRDPDISRKIQNSGPVFRAHGSEVQIFHERSRTVHLVVHRWVRGPGIFIKFLSFDCIKPRALHGSQSHHNICLPNSGPFGVVKIQGGAMPPLPPPDKNIPVICGIGGGSRILKGGGGLGFWKGCVVN